MRAEVNPDFRRSLSITRLAIVAFVIACTVFAQERPPIPGAPTDSCTFDSAPVDTPLRLLAGPDPIPYQFACGDNRPAGICVANTVQAGLIASVGTEKNGWTCITAGDGLSGWVPSDRLAAVPETPKVAVADWVGWWRNGVKGAQGTKGDRLLIQPGKTPDTLQISGRAYWYGLNDNVHLGEIKTDHVVTIGPYLRAVEGDNLGGCVLNLKHDPTQRRFSAYDNARCGGMNVRFSGTWTRFTPPAAAKKKS